MLVIYITLTIIGLVSLTIVALTIAGTLQAVSKHDARIARQTSRRGSESFRG